MALMTSANSSGWAYTFKHGSDQITRVEKLMVFKRRSPISVLLEDQGFDGSLPGAMHKFKASFNASIALGAGLVRKVAVEEYDHFTTANSVEVKINHGTSAVHMSPKYPPGDGVDAITLPHTHKKVDTNFLFARVRRFEKSGGGNPRVVCLQARVAVATTGPATLSVSEVKTSDTRVDLTVRLTYVPSQYSHFRIIELDEDLTHFLGNSGDYYINKKLDGIATSQSPDNIVGA